MTCMLTIRGQLGWIHSLTYAGASQSTRIRLAGVVVLHTPGGAGFCITPDTQKYLVEVDVDLSKWLIHAKRGGLSDAKTGLRNVPLRPRRRLVISRRTRA